VIDEPVENEICVKCSETGVKNSRQNFPKLQYSYSVVGAFHLDYTFSEILELQAQKKVNNCCKKIEKEKKER